MGGQSVAEAGDVAAEAPLAQRVGEQRFEIGFVERLADEVEGAELHRLHDGRGAALSRDDDHRHFAIDFLERRQRAEPVHRAGHDHVDDHGVGTVGVVQLDRLLRVVDGDAVVAEAVEEHPQEFADGLVVIDNHDLRLVAHHFSRLTSTRPQSNLNAEAEKFFRCHRTHPCVSDDLASEKRFAKSEVRRPHACAIVKSISAVCTRCRRHIC